MGKHSTLFAATEEELFALLPDWLVPLEKPIEKKRLNRFTPRAMLRPSWLPEDGSIPVQPPPTKLKVGPAIPPVFPPAGEFADYEASLEARAPKALKTVPHACLKNLSGDQLASLSELVRVPAEKRPARVLPSGELLACLAPAAAEKLAALSARALATLAPKWAQEEGETFPDPAEALWVLKRVQALAKLSVGKGRRVCVFVEG